jgi:hypothetical protein
VLLAGDGAVQAELAAPERFAAERIVTKDFAPRSRISFE